MKTAEILIFAAPLLVVVLLLAVIISPTGTGTNASTHAPEYKEPTTLNSDNKINKSDY